MKKTTAILAMTLGLAFAGVAHAQQKTMSIGTGGTGGVYYPLGGAVANVLSKSLPNVQATAEVTGGSIDNLKLIGAGKSELGFTMADAALDALLRTALERHSIKDAASLVADETGQPRRQVYSRALALARGEG